MVNSQTICKNRTFIYNLQQPVQDTNPLSTVTSPRNQPVSKSVSQTSRKPDHYL